MIRIFDFTKFDLCQRLEYCETVYETCDKSYKPGSLVPSGWSSVNPSSLTSIPHRFDFLFDIGIFRIPKSKYECLRRSPSEESMRSVLDSLFDHRFRDTYQYIGQCINEPGLPTCTKDLTLNVPLFIGMHVDSWDGPSIPRWARRNRFNVNIGRETRFLIFHPKPVHLIPEWSELGARVSRAQIHSYLKKHSLLYKLAVQPGEGYLAPTDDLIHDATTLGMKQPDRHVATLGMFYPLRQLKICTAITIK